MSSIDAAGSVFCSSVYFCENLRTILEFGSPKALQRPKSDKRTCPELDINMLSGLRSLHKRSIACNSKHRPLAPNKKFILSHFEHSSTFTTGSYALGVDNAKITNSRPWKALFSPRAETYTLSIQNRYSAYGHQIAQRLQNELEEGLYCTKKQTKDAPPRPPSIEILSRSVSFSTPNLRQSAPTLITRTRRESCMRLAIRLQLSTLPVDRHPER